MFHVSYCIGTSAVPIYIFHVLVLPDPDTIIENHSSWPFKKTYFVPTLNHNTDKFTKYEIISTAILRFLLFSDILILKSKQY